MLRALFSLLIFSASLSAQDFEEVHQVYYSHADIYALESATVVKDGDAWYLDLKGILSAISASIDDLKQNPKDVALVAVPNQSFFADCYRDVHAYQLLVALPQTSDWPLRIRGRGSFTIGGSVRFTARIRLPAEITGGRPPSLLRLDLAGDKDSYGGNLPLMLAWDPTNKTWSIQYGPLPGAPVAAWTGISDTIQIERFGIPVHNFEPKEVALAAPYSPRPNETFPVLRLAGAYHVRVCPHETAIAPLAVQRVHGDGGVGLVSLHPGKELDLWGTTCATAGAPREIAAEVQVLPTARRTTLKLRSKNRFDFLNIDADSTGANWKLNKDGSYYSCFP